MLKIIRKHNKWLLVGFGILLLIAFTAPELIQRVGNRAANPVVVTINGKGIRASEQGKAHQELTALERFVPPLIYGIGIESRDTAHWMLLTHEAEAAGLVGNDIDGRDFVTELAQMRTQWELQRLRQTNPQEWIQYMITEGLTEQLTKQIEDAAPFFFREAGLTQQEMHETLAKLRGVTRLVVMHNRAARFSDRQAIVEAKRAQDAAVIDYLFIPAAHYADQVPHPTPEELQAHFEQFKELRPGEGEYGIGYTLPPRARIEWMRIDRAAIERGLRLDPVEVSKRYMQNRSRYTGEFAVERPNVEAAMRGELVERAFQTAHSAIQAEVLSVTRRLPQDGRHRVLPPNWEEIRPRMDKLALTVVEAVGRNQGPGIPLPHVSSPGEWLTRSDIAAKDGLGQSFLRRGELTLGVDDLVFAAREFEGPGAPFPVQIGLPLVDHFLTDYAGNRYYLTIVDGRQESPPDSIDEVYDIAVRNFRELAAYGQLRQRTEEFQQIAAQQGLQAVTAVAARPGLEAPQIRTSVRVYRNQVENNDPNLGDPDVRRAIVDAATNIDPFQTGEQIPAETATLAIPSDQALGIAVVRIQAKAPLTAEDYRRAESRLLAEAQARELRETGEGLDNPFSLASLLQRHTYMTGTRRIQTAEELRAQDRDAEGI